MSDKTRFKVNILTGEIEIEGNQKFVEEQVQKLPGLFNSISKGKSAISKAEKAPEKKVPARKQRTKKVKEAAVAAMETSTKKPVEKKKPEKVKGRRGRVSIPAIADPEFIVYLKNYKSKLKQIDYALLSGYFVQGRSKDVAFRTADISKLLKGIDVKVSNITSTLYLLNRKKKLNILQKEGRTSLFQVTTEGEKYLVTLLKK